MRKVKHLLFLIWALSCKSEIDEASTCMDTNCADYPSQIAAQIDFDSDPECRNDLDADNDLMACEDWFAAQEKTDPSCPTTANCGCSNKSKSTCSSNCCQWIVGEGCKCR